jgi:glutathione S-transferase
MKLYVTPTSPYARLAMIVRLELKLEDDVELVWTKTRVPDDPLLAVNPSGRIPFLRLEDGSGFEDTDVIVEYLDRLAEPRRFARPEPAEAGEEAYWRFRRLEASARSMLDGVSVWAREVIRPADEQSPGIIAQEQRRAGRLAHMFDGEIGSAPSMSIAACQTWPGATAARGSPPGMTGCSRFPPLAGRCRRRPEGKGHLRRSKPK